MSSFKFLAWETESIEASEMILSKKWASSVKFKPYKKPFVAGGHRYQTYRVWVNDVLNGGVFGYYSDTEKFNLFNNPIENVEV